MNQYMALRLFVVGIYLLMAEVRRLAEAGQWKAAIELFMWTTGATQDDLVHGLGTNRTTVQRWRSGEGQPPARSLPVILDMIEELMVSRLMRA